MAGFLLRRELNTDMNGSMLLFFSQDITNAAVLIPTLPGPSPHFTFRVNLANPQNVCRYAQPADQNAINYILRNTVTIQVPGVEGNLKDGDMFVLHGQQGAHVRNVYATGDTATLQVIGIN